MPSSNIRCFAKRINSRGFLSFLNEDLLLTAFFSLSLRLTDEEDTVLVKAEG